MSEVTEKINQEVDEKKKKEVAKKEPKKKTATKAESKTKSKSTNIADNKTTKKTTTKTNSNITKGTAKGTAKSTAKKTANTTKPTTKTASEAASKTTSKAASNSNKVSKPKSENKDNSKQTKKSTTQRIKKVTNKEDIQNKEKIESKENIEKPKETKSEDTIKEQPKEESRTNKIIENDDSNLSSSQTTDESKYDTISLKEIREAIENKVDKNQKKSIIKETIINIGIAILMIIYLLIVIMGSKNIDPQTLEKDLKIMTLGILAVGIIVLEISYKKDKSKIALIGVETLVFGAANLCLIYIAKLHMDQLVRIINYISLVIAGYYIFKSIVLAITNISKFKKDNSDIKDIVTRKKQIEE